MERNIIATKVGITVIIATVVMLSAFLWLGQINPYGKGYMLKAKFSYVAGLLVGSRVQLMGVKIGEVTAVYPEDNNVVVEMEIEQKMKVPLNSKYMIAMKGLVGEKSIEIVPPDKVKGYLQANEIVEGQSPVRLDLLVQESQSILTAARQMVADPKLQKNVKSIVANLETTTTKINSMFKKFDKVTDGFDTLTHESALFVKQANQLTTATASDIKDVIASSRIISDNLKTLTTQLASTTSDKGTVKKVNDIINNTDDLIQTVNRVVKDIGDVTNDIGEITHDPEIKANIKDFTKNTKKLTDKILNPMEPKKDSTNTVRVKTELLGALNMDEKNTMTSGLKGNLGVSGNMGFGVTPYYNVGLDEIGDKNLVNFQLGVYPSKDSIIRFGIIRSKLGLGTDFALANKDTSIRGDIYDIVSPHLRIGLVHNIFDNYGLSMFWDNQFITGKNEFNLGINWQPK